MKVGVYMGLLLDNAIIFAVNAHRGQLRKGTNTPYILLHDR